MLEVSQLFDGIIPPVVLSRSQTNGELKQAVLLAAYTSSLLFAVQNPLDANRFERKSASPHPAAPFAATYAR